MFPDYQIEVFDDIGSDNFSMIIGKTSTSYMENKKKYWVFPACWKVLIIENKIQTW